MAAPASSDTILNLPADDCVIVFRTERSGVYGRLVRLGPVSQKILQPHALPSVAASLLGEAVVLAALLGSALQTSGNIAVQTKTDGVVSVVYADCEAPGKLRGYARCDTGTLAALSAVGEKLDLMRTLGTGHLAFTFDAGDGSDRYQGVVALDGGTLAEGTSNYFEQREALPTFVRVAAAQHYNGAKGGMPSEVQWRGGGIMIQDPGSRTDLASDDVLDDEDGWQRVRILTATIEDHELLDPTLTAERLLLRLFHEEGVVIERVVSLDTYCKCSREKVSTVLASFGDDDLKDMIDEAGQIAVRCEFCTQTYVFDAGNLAKSSGD